MPSVFISYRRSDTTSGYASWIYERLATVLGAEQVFMDLDSLPLGVDFVEHLERALSTATVALVLIGPTWLDAADEDGRRRLDDPRDFVRVEVAAALRASVRVIPVLIDGATLPDADLLPENISALARRQALVFQRQGGAAIRDLVEAVEQASRHELERPAAGDAVANGGAEDRRAPRVLPDYDELQVRLTPARGSTYHVEMTAASGARGRGQFVAPSQLDVERFRHTVDPRSRRVRGRSRYLEAATKFGGGLFEGLVSSASVRDVYSSARRDASGAGRGLRVTLSLGASPELASVPWEFLYDRPRFLAQHVSSPVVRFVDIDNAPPPLRVAPPLHILGMVSRPRDDDLAGLNAEDEQAALERRLRPLIDRGLVTLRWLSRATLPALQQEVDHGQDFHVFHYIGHGEYDEDSGHSSLILEHEDRRPRRVGGQQLGAVLCDRGSLRLAVLNACEAAQTASHDPLAGVATALMEYDVPAVVAMQFAITDDGALTFADEFYGALGSGYAVDAAVTQARRALAAQRDVEWGTPVLFMRVADGRLFDLQGTDTSPTPEIATATSPRESVRPSIVARAAAAARTAAAPALPAEAPPAAPEPAKAVPSAPPVTSATPTRQPVPDETPEPDRSSDPRQLDAVAPPPPPPLPPGRGGDRSAALRPTRRGAIAGGVLVAGLVAGTIAMTSGGGDGPPRSPVVGSALESGPMRVVLPAGWRASTASAGGDLALVAPASAAQPAGAARGTVTIGLGPPSSHNDAMLAADVLPAGGPARQAVVHDLAGGLQAYRYDGLRPRGTSTSLTVYVSPTSAGVATLACAGPTSAVTCRRIARTLSVGGAKPYAVGPSGDYARAVDTSLRELRSVSARLGKASTAARQATSAGAIARAIRSGRTRLNALQLSPADAEVNTRMTAALARAATAYAGLARAARGEHEAAYRRAKRAVVSSHASIAGALERLRSVGYRKLLTQTFVTSRSVPALAVAKNETAATPPPPPPATVTPPPAESPAPTPREKSVLTP